MGGKEEESVHERMRIQKITKIECEVATLPLSDSLKKKKGVSRLALERFRKFGYEAKGDKKQLGHLGGRDRKSERGGEITSHGQICGTRKPKLIDGTEKETGRKGELLRPS